MLIETDPPVDDAALKELIKKTPCGNHKIGYSKYSSESFLTPISKKIFLFILKSDSISSTL